MANEEVIRHQMEDTRTALTEKLETLETQVVDTVQGATAAVNETVETIKETVEETVGAVKDSVQDTVAAVKDTVQGGVDTVKDWMDVRAHVDNHPWLMVGGAAAVGFCLGSLLGKQSSMTAAMSQAAEPARGEAPRSHARLHHTNGGGHKRRHEASSSLSSWLSDLAPEINKLKGLALGTLLGAAREMIVQAVPQHMGEQLKEIVDNVTTKIGGEPIPSSDWENSPLKQGERHEERDQTKVGGHLGSTQGQGQKAVGQFDRR